MSFWSSERLKRELANIIKPSTAQVAVEYGSIVLHVGEEVYITPHVDIKDPSSQTKVQLSEKESFAIPAGQFAFLLTEESVAIPFNAIGFISIKARTKFRGLVNVSGFHVDPGYNGKLIFSVFNAGPAPILLQRGLELFTLWLSDLDDKATPADARNKPGYTDVPVDVINSIPGEIYSLQTLSKKISDLETSMKVHWARFGLIATIVLLVISVLLRSQIAAELGSLSRAFGNASPTASTDNQHRLDNANPNTPAPSPAAPSPAAPGNAPASPTQR